MNCMSKSFCNFMAYKKSMSTKLHFTSYTPNQMVLFPQGIDEDIA